MASRGYRYAFSLSKEQLRSERPPGSLILVSHDLERTATGAERAVDHLQLVPQPSDDPADPLTWPLWQKLSILWATCLFTFANNFVAASMAPALPLFEAALGVGLGKATQLIATQTLMSGVSNLLWVPLANVYGRRPVSIFCSVMMTLTTMWCGLTSNFNSMLAARILQGASSAAADAVTPDVVGEIFYVHQRGRAMAIYTISLVLGSQVGGISGSYIAASYGTAYIFWVGTALSGASAVFIFFLQPETLFDRLAALSPASSVDPDHLEDAGENNKAEAQEHEYSTHVERPVSYRPFTYRRSLRIGTYRGGLKQAFIAPWLSLLFPGTWLVMLQYGGLVGGIVAMATVGPQILTAPPYSWGRNVGLVNLGGIIGSLLGALYTYGFVDRRLRKTASRAPDGHVEPETRLPLLFGPLFIATTGLWTFGFSAANPAPYGWLGLVFGLGMTAFGLMSVPSIGFNYLIDAYQPICGDCFVMAVSSRALISFAWTFFVGDWVTDQGPAEPFGIFGMLMAIFSLLTVPMWMFGKRTRIATARWLPRHPER